MASMVKTPRIFGHEFCGEIVAFGPGGKRPHLFEGQYVSAEMHVTDGSCRPCLHRAPPHLREHEDPRRARRRLLRRSTSWCRRSTSCRSTARSFRRRSGRSSTRSATRSTRRRSPTSPASPSRCSATARSARCARRSRGSPARRGSRSPRSTRWPPAHARRWAKARKLSQVSVIELTRTKDPVGSLREATGGGADVVLELSGAEPSINLGLAAARPGARRLAARDPPREGGHDPRLHQRPRLQGADDPRDHRPPDLRHLDQDDRPVPRRPRRRGPRHERIRGSRTGSTRRCSCSTTGAR